MVEEDINRDEYYNDFAMPLGMRYFIAGHVLDTPSHLGLFAVQRSQASGYVQSQELALTRRRIPHIRRAIDLKFRLAQGQGFKTGLEQYLNTLAEAVFLLDSKGVTILRNAYAEKLLARQDGLRCVLNGALAIADANATEQFQRGLADLASRSTSYEANWHHDFIIRRTGMRRAYLAFLRPLFPGESEYPLLDNVFFMLLVRDPEYFSALNKTLLVDSFGLSPQELALVIALDQGLSLQEVARNREVSSTTVRSQLYSLMAKMGVKRQQELLRLLSQYRQPFL